MISITAVPFDKCTNFVLTSLINISCSGYGDMKMQKLSHLQWNMENSFNFSLCLTRFKGESGFHRDGWRHIYFVSLWISQSESNLADGHGGHYRHGWGDGNGGPESWKGLSWIFSNLKHGDEWVVDTWYRVMVLAWPLMPTRLHWWLGSQANKAEHQSAKIHFSNNTSLGKMIKCNQGGKTFSFIYLSLFATELH